MQKRRAFLARKLLSDPNTLDIDDTLLVFLETLAHMTSRKLLDRDLVWNTFSIDVCSYWFALKHYVLQIRKDFSDPTWFEEIEALNNSILWKDTPRHGAFDSQVGITHSAVERFLKLEAFRDQQT